MFYFNDKVVNLKAWQLYLGNAFWTLFIGLLLLVIAKVLGMVGLESEAVDNLLSKAGQITQARNPQVLTGLAHQVMHTPEQILRQGQHPTATPGGQHYYS